MTDQELKNLVASLAVSQAKIDALIAEAEARRIEDDNRRAEDEARREAQRAEDEARREAQRAEDEARREAQRAEDEARRAKAEAQREARRAKAEAQREARRAEEEARRAEAEAQRAKDDARRKAEDEARRAEANARQAKLDAQFAETGAQIAETDAIVRRISREHGNYINNQSRIVEEFFVKSIRKLNLRLAGIQFDDIAPNIIRHRHSSGIGIELDALMTNGEVVAILEVKTILHINDVEAVYDKRIPAFRKLFREYQDMDLLVLVGGMSINSDALDKAHEYGFICLQPDNQQLSIDASHSKRFAPLALN